MRLACFLSSFDNGMADNREQLDWCSYGEQSVRHKKALYFSFSVLFNTTFPTQNLILRCVIIVDVFSHSGRMLHIQCIHVSPHTTMQSLCMITQLNFRRNIMEWGPHLCKWWHLNLLLQVRFHDVDNAAGANVDRSTWVIWASCKHWTNVPRLSNLTLVTVYLGKSSNVNITLDTDCSSQEERTKPILDHVEPSRDYLHHKYSA